MRICIYCDFERDENEFSDEHIFPRALGGDFLGDFWRTQDVCQRCNSMAGVYVDGAYIKSHLSILGSISSSQTYMSIEDPALRPMPMFFMTTLSNFSENENERVDLWVGACGATVFHFRPINTEDDWVTYVGGDPKKQIRKQGRAYMVLKSSNEYWIYAALSSFKKHFKYEKRFVLNWDVSKELSQAFRMPDIKDPVQSKDLQTINSAREENPEKNKQEGKYTLQLGTETRFLAKLGLGIGYKIWGNDFLKTNYSKQLRKAFREADHKKLQDIEIFGTGHLLGDKNNKIGKMFKWDGGWLLILQLVDKKLTLTVITPSGNQMIILVCPDVYLTKMLSPEYNKGIIWLTVPQLMKGVCNLSLSQYLAHLSGGYKNAQLLDIEAYIIDPQSLPPCS